MVDPSITYTILSVAMTGFWSGCFRGSFPQLCLSELKKKKFLSIALRYSSVCSTCFRAFAESPTLGIVNYIDTYLPTCIWRWYHRLHICTPFTVNRRIYNNRGVATVTPKAIIPEDDYRYNSVVIYDHIVRRAQRQLVTRRLPQPPLTRRPGPRRRTYLAAALENYYLLYRTRRAGARLLAYTLIIIIFIFSSRSRSLVHRMYTSYKYGITLCLMGMCSE